MKKIILLITLLFTVSFFTKAAEVPVEKAKFAALKFINERFSITSERNSKKDLNFTVLNSFKYSNLYIFNTHPEGFVIVSVSDKAQPVLAYSFKGSIEESNLRSEYKIWLDNYSDQIKYLEENSIRGFEKFEREWNYLLSQNTDDTRLRNIRNVEPLFVTKWGQSAPYNGACPKDTLGSNGRAITGCVATAMGQLLYYYRFPYSGVGSYSYTHAKYGEIYADFSKANYKWHEMLSVHKEPNEAVAEILFHQGVSVDMDYGPNASAMWHPKTDTAFRKFFKYNEETIYYLRDENSARFDSVVVANLDLRRPMYYAGWVVPKLNGHAFVCDGYQGENYYHFNWGWNGGYDGYYYTDNLAPGGYDFNLAQEVVPLFPDTAKYVYPADTTDNYYFSYSKASIDDGSAYYPYKPNTNKTWYVTPLIPESDSISLIELNFMRFDLANGDTLYIKDFDTKEILYKLTGNEKPEKLKISKDKLILNFISDNNENGLGFEIEYSVELPTYCHSTNPVIVSDYGKIEDGSGAKNYQNNTSCMWRIKSIDKKPLNIRFTKLNIKDPQDFVRIYDFTLQKEIAKVTGTDIPEVISVESGNLMIQFVTDETITDEGWEALFYTSEYSVETQKISQFEIYPNPANDFVIIKTYSEKNDKINVKLCDSKGKIIVNKTKELSFGENLIKVEFNSLASMAYFLMIHKSSEKPQIFPIIVKKI